MNLRQYTAGALAIAGAVLLASGCGGTSCPTETPAQIQKVGQCQATLGATVSVPVQLCPTCNQTGARCQVDASSVASSGIIQLDPTVEACDNVSTCSSPAPSCQVGPLMCAVTVPSNTTMSQITLAAFDPFSGQQVSGVINIVPSGSSGCTL